MIDKIRAEIERQISTLKIHIIEHPESAYVKGCLDQVTNILAFINSLPEEHVSKDLEEYSALIADELPQGTALTSNSEFDIASVRKLIIDACKLGANWQKEKDSISAKDLEEVISYLSKRYPEVSFAKLSRIAVYVVKWQQEKEYTCYEEAFEDGAQWQKEQMMAKAIDGDITFDYYGDDDKTYGCIAHDSFCLEDFGLKDTDKVKMVIVKDEMS